MEAENYISYNELQYGEKYISTEEHTYSNFDDRAWPLIEVPKNSQLLFRSFQEHGYNKDNQLALFYWLEKKMTVCVLVSDKTPILFLKHLKRGE